MFVGEGNRPETLMLSSAITFTAASTLRLPPPPEIVMVRVLEAVPPCPSVTV